MAICTTLAKRRKRERVNMDAKSSTMVRAKSLVEQPSLSHPKTANNYSPIDYPTSPQLLYGEEIIHQSHQHPLSKINLADLFTCVGCKEHGSGKRYSCQPCDFQLHDFCALAPHDLKSHPFHHHHHLSFNPKPVKSRIAKSKCGACGKPVKGYSFRCKACSFQMHPCCAMLPEELIFSTHPQTLKLLPASSQGGDSAFICGECKRKRSGRVYRCTNCDYHLHAVCAKRIVNGLHDNGIKRPDNPGVFGKAARLASQAVIGFIGGLVEGIGEGVGEAFIQNIGSCQVERTEMNKN